MALLPFKGNYPITQKFGVNPATYGTGGHRGIDYGTPNNTPIIAIADGVVKKMPFQSNGFGTHLTLSFGNYIVYYGHLDRVTRTGAVKKGWTIGYTDNTGWSTGPHLHLETYENRKLINPQLLLNKLGDEMITKSQLNVLFRFYLGQPPTAKQYSAYVGKRTFDQAQKLIRDSQTLDKRIAQAKAGTLVCKNHLPTELRNEV